MTTTTRTAPGPARYVELLDGKREIRNRRRRHRHRPRTTDPATCRACRSEAEVEVAFESLAALEALAVEFETRSLEALPTVSPAYAARRVEAPIGGRRVNLSAPSDTNR